MHFQLTIQPIFNVASTNIRTAVVTPSLGAPKLAPFDVKIVFNKIDTADGKYLFPGDTINPSSGSIKIQTPFKIYNATDTTKLSAIIVDQLNKGRWDWGEKIIILTPPPYKVTNSSTMLEINFILSADSTKKPTFSGGEFILLKLKAFIYKRYLRFSISKPYYNLAIADEELKKCFCSSKSLCCYKSV